MDIRTFIAEMTKALAWPIGLIAIGLIFRRTIAGLLAGVRLRQIKRGEWSADFETAAQEVRAELPSSVQQTPESGQSGSSDEQTMILAEIAPAAAIAQEWNVLEGRVKTIAVKAGITQQLLPEVLRDLVGKGLISGANCRRDFRVAEHA